MPRHPISQPPTIEPVALAFLLTAVPVALAMVALPYLRPRPTLRQRAVGVGRTLTTLALAEVVGRRPRRLTILPRRR